MRARPAMVKDSTVAPPALSLKGETNREHSLGKIVSAETVQQCTAAYGETLRAVVLTGSMARGEATFLQEGSKWKVLGDGEFLLIFQTRATIPNASSVKEISKSVERALESQGLNCEITLGAVGPDYLRKLEPTIFAYELRACGQVVWGKEDILSLIPPFLAGDIRLDDAWQMLCNRMIELLEGVLESDRSGPLCDELYYKTVKLYLDLATSFLVFVGAYEPTYQGRAARLRSFADAGTAGEDGPFPLGNFAECVSACTDWKMGGGVESGPPPTWEFWRSGVSYAEQLWRWETAHLTGLTNDSQLPHLWRRQMSLQPVTRRLRGWLYLLQEAGWRRSSLRWPFWLRRAWMGSPRFWIYAATTEVVFHLSDLVSNENDNGLLSAESRGFDVWLPCARTKRNHRSANWESLAADIVSHYHDFLVGTRS